MLAGNSSDFGALARPADDSAGSVCVSRSRRDCCPTGRWRLCFVVVRPRRQAPTWDPFSYRRGPPRGGDRRRRARSFLGLLRLCRFRRLARRGRWRRFAAADARIALRTLRLASRGLGKSAPAALFTIPPKGNRLMANLLGAGQQDRTVFPSYLLKLLPALWRRGSTGLDWRRGDLSRAPATGGCEPRCNSA